MPINFPFSYCLYQVLVSRLWRISYCELALDLLILVHALSMVFFLYPKSETVAGKIMTYHGMGILTTENSRLNWCEHECVSPTA